MIEFFNGVAFAGSLGVGVFFLRLWRETRDRFFVLFGSAFFVLAFNWLLIVCVTPVDEHRHLFYLGRLLAFLLIIAAIVDKNRSASRS